MEKFKIRYATVTLFTAAAILFVMLLLSIPYMNSIINSSGDALKTKATDNAEFINSWLGGQSDIMITMATQISNMEYDKPEKIVEYLAQNIGNNEIAMEYYIYIFCLLFYSGVFSHGKYDTKYTFNNNEFFSSLFNI